MGVIILLITRRKIAQFSYIRYYARDPKCHLRNETVNLTYDLERWYHDITFSLGVCKSLGLSHIDARIFFIFWSCFMTKFTRRKLESRPLIWKFESKKTFRLGFYFLFANKQHPYFNRAYYPITLCHVCNTISNLYTITVMLCSLIVHNPVYFQKMKNLLLEMKLLIWME